MNLEKVKKIIAVIKEGKLSYSEIGKMFGTSKQYIGQLAKKNNLGRRS